MSDVTLLIFEGEKTEPKLFANIETTFFQGEGSTRLYAAFKGDIYSLWNVLKQDKDLDVFQIVKERNLDQPQIRTLERQRVSQIFLFFDYDGQVPGSSDDNLSKMIQFFDEETEHGKLYISYPMVEAIKDYHLSRPGCYRRCTIEGRSNIKYKGIVAGRSGYTDINTIGPADWRILIEHGLKRARCLLFNGYEYPSQSEHVQMTQERILTDQRTKHVDPTRKVAIISSFPLFIVDYFGYGNYAGLLE
jgi:hypothetical protein